jgi:hypothetical protein
MGLASRRAVEMPQHAAVLRFLAANGAIAPSLEWPKLAHRARLTSATAGAFERVLRVVKPRLAFVVTYYAGLGAAFLLACRRQGILSIDIQHCPQDGAHKAYDWSSVPKNGYATLPSVFWNWTQRDAASIGKWTGKLALPWHRAIHAGHTQIAAFLDDGDSCTKGWDDKFSAVSPGMKFDREILVALQPIGGHRSEWDDLCAQIKAAPSRWRWWIRRHPASREFHDREYAKLLSLQMTNVNLHEASTFPLPALLRHMSHLVSLASGSAAEAEYFGVPAIFLSEEARGPFLGLIERGLAAVMDVRAVCKAIESSPRTLQRRARDPQPNLGETLEYLQAISAEYSALCRTVERGLK